MQIKVSGSRKIRVEVRSNGQPKSDSEMMYEGLRMRWSILRSNIRSIYMHYHYFAQRLPATPGFSTVTLADGLASNRVFR